MTQLEGMIPVLVTPGRIGGFALGTTVIDACSSFANRRTPDLPRTTHTSYALAVRVELPEIETEEVAKVFRDYGLMRFRLPAPFT